MRCEHHVHRLAELVQHCALLRWRVGGRGRSANGNRWRRRGCADDVDFARGVFVPEIDLQDEEVALYGVWIDLLAGVFMGDYQTDAGRGRDGASVLVAETTHAGSLGLLLDSQFVAVFAFDAAEGHCLWLGLYLGRHALLGRTVHLLLILGHH